MTKPSSKPTETGAHQTLFRRCWTLFWVFLKIGAFTFGGGYAMIPLIQREVVDKHGWITAEDILDIFAIAESTPGVIAVNTATFVGYKIGGIVGAVMATLGVVLPSFAVISVISLFILQFKALKWVSYAFEGVRAAVVVLILNAALSLNKVNKRSAFNLIVTLTAFCLSLVLGLNVIFILLGAVAAGLLYCLVLQKDAADGKGER